MHQPKTSPGTCSHCIAHCAPVDIFHIGMKLGTGSVRDRLGRHYSYYSQSELTEHLNKAGFVVDDASTGKDMGLAGDVEPWIVLRAHKQAE